VHALPYGPVIGGGPISDKLAYQDLAQADRIRARTISMWGRPPFSIADNCAIDVRNLAALREWYKKTLGLREAPDDREEDSGRPFVDLRFANDETLISLVQLKPGASPESGHVIFYAKNLEKAQQWLAEREVFVEPITADSGGNRFFRFHDLEGNKIEVCIEPS
jgi:catechol 2,3-dioxygenase-like lactoylglutathione lyase family enzyme